MTPETKLKGEIKEYLTKGGWEQFPLVEHKYRGVEGLPDRIAFKHGVVLFIEVKTKAGKLRPKQVEWQGKFLQNKCYYLVVRSVEQLDEELHNIKSGGFDAWQTRKLLK